MNAILIKHNLALIRAIHVTAAQCYLPSFLYTARRSKDIVIVIALVELRPFNRVITFHLTVINEDRLTNNLISVSRQFAHRQHTVETTTAGSPPVYEIASSVLVPQRARINHTLALHHQHWLAPSSERVITLHHEHTKIRVAPIDVICVIMPTDAGCPYPAAVLNGVVMLNGQQSFHCIIHQLPMYQVRAVENGQSWRTLKTTCRQPIVTRSTLANIRIAVVGIDDLSLDGQCIKKQEEGDNLFDHD